MKTSIKYIIALLFVLLDIQSSASIITLYNFTANLITENTIPKQMKADIMYYQFKFNLNIPQFSIYHQPKKTYFNY